MSSMHPSRPNIGTIGEVLWDQFPSGPRFGGAPANFGYHAAALGAKVTLLSAVGNDSLGERAEEILHRSGIDTRWLARTAGHPTGQVNVKVDDKGHASYSFNRDEAFDHIPWNDDYLAWLSQLDAICFGTLAQRAEQSYQTIHRVLESCRPETYKVLDLNLRPPFVSDDVLDRSLAAANALKLNDDELQFLAKRENMQGDELALAQQIRSRHGFRWLALTRGARGGLLLTANEHHEEPAQPVALVDTVGAGDSFTAAVVMGFLTKQPLAQINHAACRIAEFVCSQPGATPALPSSLIPHWVER